MNFKPVALIVGALVVTAAVYYFVTQKRPGAPAPGPAEQVEPMLNVFHPDSVVAFRWKTKSKTHAFLRANRDKSWVPEADPQDIQERLNLIAVANYQKLEKPAAPLVEVTVAFGEKNQWNGAWDGEYFYWTDGTFE